MKLIYQQLFSVLSPSLSASFVTDNDDKVNFSNNSFIPDSSLKERNEFEFESDRIMITSSIIASFNHQRVAIDISKIISSYNRDKSLEDLYYQVMSVLFESKNNDKEKKRCNGYPDFFNENFAIQLVALLKRNSLSSSFENVKCKNENFFWHNLARLFFKWMLHMWQSDPSERKFQKVSKSIKMVAFIIHENNIFDFPVDFKLSLMSPSTFVMFKQLMRREFLDNFFIFNSFSLILDDFYNKKITLKELENIHFGKSFNENLLLKFLILMYDPIGSLKMECFPESDYFPFLTRSKRNGINELQLTPSYLDDLRKRGPKSLLISNMKLLNESIINFFLENNKKFAIEYSGSLIILLRKLKKFKLLTRKPLNKIVKFKFQQGEPNDWNWKFKDFLEKRLKINNISQIEYEEYLKLL